MAARDVIVASVRDFLRDIQQLNLEKAGLEAVNPVKASYLQSQIWRKVTIIDSLVDSCPEAKEVLEKEILRKRKEFKAEAEDLKMTRVPKAVDACPTDQLNLGEVLPADGEMMGWNQYALLFEKVLSILISRELLTYDDIKNLILAGDYMQIAASSWYETHLKNSFNMDYRNPHYYSRSAGGFRKLKNVTNDEFALNPIPACIQMDFLPDEDEDNEEEETFTQKQFRILRDMGHNIWNCAVRIRGMTTMQSMTRIRECFALIPNVKYLELKVFNISDYPNPDAEDIRYFEGVELPDLPNLEALKLGLVDCEGMVAKVLRKYGNQLSHLETKHLPDVTPEDGVAFPFLEVVNVGLSWPFSGSSVDPLVQIARLRNLHGSRLKVVHFGRNYDGSAGAGYLQSLICCLNQFRGTLEELDLTFSSGNVTGGVGDLAWLANIEFPKVKKLTIRNNPGTWNFVLHFPALETLTWYYPRGNRFYIFEPGKHFQFSWQEWDMCTSDVWKMLPFLTSIEIRHCFVGHKVIRTRSEALAYQEKYGRAETEIPGGNETRERGHGNSGDRQDYQ